MATRASGANDEPAELLRIESSDGASVEARVFLGGGAGAVVVAMPAMGVPAAYYDPLGRQLADKGHDFVAADLRGTGTSSVRPGRGRDFGYHQMVSTDYVAALASVRARFSGRPLVLLGHSLGGQLGALHLAMHPGAFDALVLVACGSVDYRGWAFPANLRILAGTQVAGLIARAFGYFPGHRVGFGGKQPKQVIVDWSTQGRTGRYAPKGATIDYEAGLGQVEVPLLAVSVEGDELAPAGAVDRLVRKMPRAKLTRLHLQPSWPVARSNDAHFRWAREPGQIAAVISEFVVAFDAR